MTTGGVARIHSQRRGRDGPARPATKPRIRYATPAYTYDPTRSPTPKMSEKTMLNTTKNDARSDTSSRTIVPIQRRMVEGISILSSRRFTVLLPFADDAFLFEALPFLRAANLRRPALLLRRERGR